MGKSIREAAFRGRFHAAVVAIKRDGMPLNWSGTHIGDEVLKVGAQLNITVAVAVASHWVCECCQLPLSW